MKLLLNKEAFQSDIWGSAIGFFNRVFGDVEILSIEGVAPGKKWFHKLQYSLELKFAGKINDNADIFEKRFECSTENIVLNLSCQDIKKVISTYPSSEVWNIEYNGENVSFWEVGGIGLSELTTNADTIRIDFVKYVQGGRFVVDSAFYNPHYSACRNFQKMLSTMPRVFARIICGDTPQIPTYESAFVSKFSYSKYILNFYGGIIKKYWAVISNKLFGYYNERWTVAIGNGCFHRDGVSKICVQSMPKDEFWADPFLVDKDGKKYLFFEKFPFDKKKGIISVGEVVNGRVLNVRDIIEQPYHLSYPNVFEEDGTYYMIPECSANRRIEIYKCIDFPEKWELYSYGFDGESLVDTCYYKDKDGQRWLIASCSWNDIDTHNEVLNIYQIDSLKLNLITPHKNNPVIVDSRKGRNGGRIYVEDGVVIRVAQDNRYGKYGHGVSLQAIEKLTLDSYMERPIVSFKGEEIEGYSGTHQMCQIDDMFVMDLRQ